jgi:hypothetical protein
MRRHVADDQGKLLLRVGPQEQNQLAEFLGELGVATNLHVAPLHDRLGALAAERQQAEGAADDLCVRAGVASADSQRNPRGLQQ